jgi:hypothetical protein
MFTRIFGILRTITSYLQTAQNPGERPMPSYARNPTFMSPLRSSTLMISMAGTHSKRHTFLTTQCITDYSIIGYELADTFRKRFGEPRGMCCRCRNNHFNSWAQVIYRTSGWLLWRRREEIEVPFDSKVSMNFWCFDPSIFAFIENFCWILSNMQPTQNQNSLFQSSGTIHKGRQRQDQD